VTADCVHALARAHGGRFVLLGRSAQTPWPEGLAPCEDLKSLRGEIARAAAAGGQSVTPAQIDREARAALAGAEIAATLAGLHGIGVEATYRACDLADRASLNTTLEEIRARFGPVTGLIHGAGVLADQPITAKTREAFERVFSAKVGGLANLLDGLDREALTHIALFSSAAAAFGNAGQADYAMANEVLNRQAQALAVEAPGRVVKAFNWGPWDGGMVDETLARAFRERGVSLIPRAAGAALFAEEMTQGTRADVELVIGERWD